MDGMSGRVAYRDVPAIEVATRYFGGADYRNRLFSLSIKPPFKPVPHRLPEQTASIRQVNLYATIQGNSS
jgi:hypothetical protein